MSGMPTDGKCIRAWSGRRTNISANRGVSTRGVSLRLGLLLEHQPAAIVHEAYARKKRHAEQITFERIIGLH